MKRAAELVFMALMAVALGIVCFMVAYAATDWYRTGSGFIFSLIDKDPMAAAHYAWADLRAFNLTSVQYAVVGGALGFFLPLVIAFFMRPRRTNDARFMSMSDVARAGLTKRGGVFIGRAGGKLVEALTYRTMTGARTLRFSIAARRQISLGRRRRCWRLCHRPAPLRQGRVDHHSERTPVAALARRSRSARRNL